MYKNPTPFVCVTFNTDTNSTASYIAPHIEIVDIETEQNILGGSGTVPDYPIEDW